MLVGRKAERAKLDALVEGALQGQGGALLLTGEPGIGKTVLLDDVAARRDGELTLLRAVGREESDLPFAALADLVGPETRAFDALPELQARALRRALALEGGEGAVDGLSVGVAVLGVLARLSGRRPLLLVVDDLQWVDEPSRVALLFVARRLGRLHIALACSARDGMLPEGEVASLPRVQLGGLRAREASELFAKSVRVSADPAVRRRLLELARGNPLALVELPTALTDAQLAGLEPLGEPIAVNGGLERTFGARVKRLPQPAQEALLLAATAGVDAYGSLVAALARERLDMAELVPAERDRLVSLEPGAVVFRHPLVRSVVYHGVSLEERRAAHALLARVDDDADRRAWHLAAAAPGPDETVAVELDGAARRALERGAPASAARAFETAADLSPTPEARAPRLAWAARAAHRAGDVPAAGRFAARARELTADPVVRGDLLVVESDVRMRAGDLDGAHRDLTTHAAALEEIDRSRASIMLLLAAKLRIYQLDADLAAGEVERALRLLPAGELGVLHRAALSMSRAVAGDDRAREAALAAAEAAASSPHGHAHTLATAWPLIWLEEYEAAREVTTRAIATQREGGFLLYLPQSLLPRAELDFRTGDWQRGLESAREALDLFVETKQTTEAASAAAIMSRMEAACGNGDACRTLAQQALASDVECGLRSSSAHALAALGLLALGARNPSEAIPPLASAERIAARGGVGEPWLLLSAPDLIEAHAHAGDEILARELLDSFRERLGGRGRVSAEAAALRCEGILGKGPWADAFERALVLHDRVPTPFERARTELCYGERLRRARKRSDARSRLRSALETFEELGAAPWAERARAELRASGETARRRSSPADLLTPQELAVTRLVSEGATNRETAGKLYVSEKTVEFHLRNAYRKLDVRSRSELARLVARQG